MNATLATVLCLAGIGGVFWLNRDPQAKTSKALWLPVIWLSIACSRMISQWLAIFDPRTRLPRADAVARYMDGSPLDRLLLTIGFVLALAILAGRRQKVFALLRLNVPIVFFLAYCGMSAIWSDYPDVAFKRWIKALADFSMVLIVLTEADRKAAIKRLLARTGFVLVPLSLLLIKYYPAGRGWSEWGESAYTGVATSKNELGGMCLLMAIACFWQVLQLLRENRRVRNRRSLIAQGVILLMALFLLWSANAVTAMACFAIAACIIVAMNLRVVSRRRSLVHAMVATFIALPAASLFLQVGSGVVEQMGRDSTLTGRTDIWKLVISMTRSSVFGTGFESFWLGSRLDRIWSIYWWHPNEAHNGYIEVFLNLGCVGLVLLLMLFVTSYKNVLASMRRDRAMGSLRLAYFVVAIVYNFTESAIRIMHPVWILFLLAGTAVREERVPAKESAPEREPLIAQEELSWSR